MFIVDDPMLALIARFVLDLESVEVSDQEFIREQVKSMRAWVERFPSHERQSRAVEWVERHAKRYRLAWQKRVISGELGETRCSDCPLAQRDDSRRCAIHTKWTDLLQAYVRDQISSREYVEETLALLSTHKEQLRIILRMRE